MAAFRRQTHGKRVNRCGILVPSPRQSRGISPIVQKVSVQPWQKTVSTRAYSTVRKRAHAVGIPSASRIWDPLLQHLNSTHSDFAPLLVETIIDEITSQAAPTHDSEKRSVHVTLAGWLQWISHTWSTKQECQADSILQLLFIKTREYTYVPQS